MRGSMGERSWCKAVVGGILLVLAVGVFAAAIPTAESPESVGVRSAELKDWADSLEKDGFSPRVAIVLRHGKVAGAVTWGGHYIHVSEPLKGLTRALGLSIAGTAERVGAWQTDDALLARMLKPGADGEAAGDELGAVLERVLRESPAAFFSDRFMWTIDWDWGGVAAVDGSFRCATGAWMHPIDLAMLALANLNGGVCGKARAYSPEFAKRHPFGLMAYDGSALAVDSGKDAVVLVMTDSASARDSELVASVRGFLKSAFAEGALPQDPAAFAAYKKTRARQYKGTGSGRPATYPPLPAAPPTFGKRHMLFELVPDGKIVGRNSESDIVKLKDGRLLFAWSQMLGSTDDDAHANLMKIYSSDRGKTWTKPEVMIARSPRSTNVMCVNFLRLKDGRLALFYLDKIKGGDVDCRPVMRVSSDEGETWSEQIQVIPDELGGYYVMNNAQAFQCADGRLVLPAAQHSWAPCAKRRGPAQAIVAWYSTDVGKTWKRSETQITVKSPTFSNLRIEEPGVVELKDGRLRMHFRTNANWQYVSFSSDGGRTWSPANPSTMRSPRVSATIVRLSDGNLYAAWNDHSRDPDFRFRMPYFNGECCPLTFGVSTDEGETWIPLVDIEREGHFCYPFIREIDGYVFMGYCCRIGMKDQRLVRFRLDEVMRSYKNVGTAETTARDFTADDFKTIRKDGAFDQSLGWALDTIRRQQPVYDADKVTSAAAVPAWREKVRAKLRELLQVRDDLGVPFKCIATESRDGYELRKYEFSLYSNLVTRAWACVPMSAKVSGARLPAVVCMPGNGGSLESMTGEADPHFTRYPLRNRQAYWYAKAGFVAIAMENPASAGNSVPGMDYNRVQSYYFELMQFAGLSTWGLATEQVLACVEFLKGLPYVDARRIAASGLSLGCFSTLYASVLSDDIKAVVYNDFVCSWAQRYLSVTERPGGWSPYAARGMVGAYRWFDDQPDLMAALAPRPLFLVEDGHGKACVDKVRRAYARLGASDKLKFRRYPKYAFDAARTHDGEDFRLMSGLTDDEYLARSNVDPSLHSFHPEEALPWLCAAMKADAGRLTAIRGELEAAVAEREHFAFAPSARIVKETKCVDWSDAARVERGDGFTRYHYTVDGCAAWVVAPDKPLAGNPWVWEMEFPGAFGDRTGAMKLVAQGFHDAHIVVGNNFACPASMKHFDAFWQFLVKKGLDKKCTPMGYSRGGLYGMRFAIAHPERVHAVYGDAPVCDFKSWPGGTGKGKGSPDNWQRLIKVYGFKDEAEAIAWKGNPISNLKPLAEADVPLIFVVGDADQVVPPCENAELVEKRYKAMGGTVHVFHKPGVGHHPHGLENPKPVLDLIRKYALGE